MDERGGDPRAANTPSALQDEGRKVLAALYGAMRALKFYPLENDVVQQALAEVQGIVTPLLDREGGLGIRMVGDFFFLNDTRLRLDLRNFSTFGSFAHALRVHGVGEVTVEAGVELREWAPFLALFLREAADGDPFEGFLERLSATPVRAIEVQAEREAQPLDLEGEALEGAKRTYAHSVQAAREALADTRIGRAVNVGKVKRAVQGIVDQVLSNEPSILAMTTLRDFDEYTFTHSVNVCIFSVVIGQRLELEKRQLYELGLGALFHDVGKSRIEGEVLNKEEHLTDEEWEILKAHPTEGLLALFQMQGFLDIPYRQMLVAYEHHMKTDLTGYPPTRRPREIGLFSRIVAVADGFDAGTSVRSYQFKPWSPDEVMKEMRDNPKRGFDPLLVKALMTATGVYPVGTLVILDTFELGVVTRANPDPERPHQPEVKILADEMGMPLPEPIVARLDEADPATGQARRTIIKTADPNRYDIRVADYVTN
ncbi:MAG: HD domain-containing phosphohydrolase [Gemmatimonadota bacterium]